MLEEDIEYLSRTLDFSLRNPHICVYWDGRTAGLRKLARVTWIDGEQVATIWNSTDFVALDPAHRDDFIITTGNLAMWPSGFQKKLA